MLTRQKSLFVFIIYNVTIQIKKRIIASQALPKYTMTPIKITKKHVCWSLVLTGILFRLARYLSNPAMNIDESNYAFMLNWLSLKDILLEKKFIYPAPPGFIAIQKLAATFFSNNEYVLRFVPFLSSIGALLLLNKIKNCFSKSTGGILALALLVACPSAIYFSCLDKAYSSDVLVALGLCWLGLKVHASPLGYRSMILLVLSAAVAIWLSFPAIFILGGLFLALLWEYIQKKDLRNLKRLLLIGIPGSLISIFFYFSLVQRPPASSPLYQFWFKGNNALIYNSASFLSYIKWGVSFFYNMFRNVAGIDLPLLGIFFFVLGCYAVYSMNKFKCLLLALPIFLATLATIFQKYPARGKLILFLIPSLFLMIGVGWEFLYNQEKRILKNGSISWFLLILLLFHPYQTTIVRHTHNKENSGYQQVLWHVKNHLKKDDGVGIYYMASTPFEFYKDEIDFPDSTPCLTLRPDKIKKNIEQLSLYKRVWIIFKDNNDYSKDKQWILYHFNQKARQMRSFHVRGGSCYLYEFP